MYIPAYDHFHAVFRMLHLLRLFGDDCVEVDRLRIFDFFLLFPHKVYGIHLKRAETDFRRMRSANISRTVNPYNNAGNDRLFFERLRPYQMSALRHLAAYGLISVPLLAEQKVMVADSKKLAELTARLCPLASQEDAALTWLFHCFRATPMNGDYGLKYRTGL